MTSKNVNKKWTVFPVSLFVSICHPQCDDIPFHARLPTMLRTVSLKSQKNWHLLICFLISYNEYLRIRGIPKAVG